MQDYEEIDTCIYALSGYGSGADDRTGTEGKTVTYIPTAGIAEEVEGMVEEETSTLESLGMTVDVLEVSTASQEEIVDSLKRNDVIFVGGGNTFFCCRS